MDSLSHHCNNHSTWKLPLLKQIFHELLHLLHTKLSLSVAIIEFSLSLGCDYRIFSLSSTRL